MGQKKIKLITFAPHPNFGTCLQSYALNFVLRKLGHDVEFIYNRRENPPIGFFLRLKNISRRLLYHILPSKWISKKNANVTQATTAKKLFILTLPDNKLLYLLSYLPFYNKIYNFLKYRNVQQKKVCKFAFKDGNFKMRRIYTHAQYERVSKDTDIFITGSDQIWNPYCGGFNPMMFVEFGGSTKRIAYSSSISQEKFPPSLIERIKCDLAKFSHIGVREKSSVKLLNCLLGRDDVKLVVDPTYLLSPTEWRDFGNRAQIEFELPEKYIFCYFVGDTRQAFYEKMVQEAKAFTGIDKVIVLECYNRSICYGGGSLYKNAGPYEWVYLLEHSAYVCTDSFHATVFSLKFKKDFVHALKNEERELGSQNSRMHDIFSRYGLLGKIYDNDNMSWRIPVDYSKISSIMDAEIRDSINFLKYEIEC